VIAALAGALRGDAGRRLAAGTLLAAGAAVGIGAAASLARLESLPQHPLPFYLAFGLSLCAGLAAGLVAPRRADSAAGGTASPPIARSRLSFMLWGAAPVLLFAATWRLGGRPDPPLTVYLLWAGSVAAAVLAFPRAAKRRDAAPRAGAGGVLGLLLLALVLAAVARLAALDRIPPVFSGDEANQTIDGLDNLRGRYRGSPFGTGWYSTMRLGMLPAGAGAHLLPSQVGGPRFPYAVAGTLAVVSTAAAAGRLAGPWAAAAAAALLAFAPHHVHFSRLASVMVLDSLWAALLVLLLCEVRRSGSPRLAALAGAAAGLALYGYAGGRVITLAFLLAAPFALFGSSSTRGRRALLAVALAAGFVAAAGPNLTFAVRHFADWNGRFNQVSLFAPTWWQPEIALWHTPARVLVNQFHKGTLGLLSMKDWTSWFTGHPLIGPPVLSALVITGLGWMVGRRQLFPAGVLSFLAAGNLAGVMFTAGAPSAHRASSLLPVLAILGGVAAAGFLSLLPERAEPVPWRAAVGALLVLAYLGRTAAGFPTDPAAHARFGGDHAAFVQSVSGFLASRRARGETVYLHGKPEVDLEFPSFRYFARDVRIVDLEPEQAASSSASDVSPGVHLFGPELAGVGRGLKEILGLRHAVVFGHPAYPLRDTGYAFVLRR